MRRRGREKNYGRRIGLTTRRKTKFLDQDYIRQSSWTETTYISSASYTVITLIETFTGTQKRSRNKHGVAFVGVARPRVW